MAKFQSPLLGYNNNVRHRGRIFHIQTEDSGVNHPHIITHLFMDGGRILKSVKKSYAEHVGSDGLSETVRVLMKEQHKEMFIALRDGQFDSLVDGGVVKKPSGQVVAPAAAPKETPKKAEEAPKEVAAAAAKEPTKAEPPAPVPPPPKKIPPPKIDLSKLDRPKTETKIDPAAVQAAAAAAAAATAKVLAEEEPAFLTELAKTPEVAITEGAGGGGPTPSLVASAPSTRPDPPRAPDEMPPNTIEERRTAMSDGSVIVTTSEEEIDLDEAELLGNLPLPSDSDEVMVVDVDEPPKTSPEDDIARAATDPPPPPSVRIPSPQSTTDPSATLERAATVAAMPASRPRPAVVTFAEPPRSPPPAPALDENPNTMRDPERVERRRQSAEELTLDFDALERDSTDSNQVSAHFQTTDLPPPPKNLFTKERGTGAYSAMLDDGGPTPPSRPQPPNTARSSVAAAASPPASAPEKSAPPKPSQKPVSEGRYAPARPAAIFGASTTPSAKPPPAQASPTSSSLFNDDLVSDKSLDEVILSYLAEDLDPPRRK